MTGFPIAVSSGIATVYRFFSNCGVLSLMSVKEIVTVAVPVFCSGVRSFAKSCKGRITINQNVKY
jgi:hypothetical protein